jgi:ketosteroid isomerase-like protein
MTRKLGAALVSMSLTGPVLAAETNAEMQKRVRDRETAFARSMADRDHAAFVSFLAEETLFFGPDRVLRGKKEVAAGWKPFFEGPQAPFAWAPERVEVVDSGTLALSTGPVTDPATRKRTGTFNSTWRREADGEWRIVLDNGCPRCQCPEAEPPAKK